jgi:hypothetical protein
MPDVNQSFRRFTNCYAKCKNRRCRIQSIHYRSVKAARLAHIKAMVTSSRVLRSQQQLKWTRDSQHIMEPDISMRRLQQAAAHSYPSQMNPMRMIISHVGQINFTIVIPFTSRSRKWPFPSVFPIKFSTHFSRTLHASLISFSLILSL